MQGLSTEQRFWSKVAVRFEPGCWLWTAFTNEDGYGRFTWRSRPPGQPMVMQAHRVAWQLTHGYLPEGYRILHDCDEPRCCNPKHLFIGTQVDNMRDRQQKGRQARGDKLRNRDYQVLDWNKAREIRQRFAAEPVSKKQLAREYGVTDTQIRNVILGKSWNENNR